MKVLKNSLFIIINIAITSCYDSSNNNGMMNGAHEIKNIENQFLSYCNTKNINSNTANSSNIREIVFPEVFKNKKINETKFYNFLKNPYFIATAAGAIGLTNYYYMGNISGLISQLFGYVTPLIKSKLFLWGTGMYLAFKASGKMLDLEAERVVDQLYSKNPKNPNRIKGIFDIGYINTENKKIILFFHGLTGKPDCFRSLMEDLSKNNPKCDLASLLLPNHGTNLKDLGNIKNTEIENFLHKRIAYVCNNYEKVTIYLKSYSASIFLSLYKSGRLEKFLSKIQIILESPNVYNKKNNLTTLSFFNCYKFWRNYCNYEFLGFRRDPVDQDEDLRFMVVSSGLQALEEDNKARGVIPILRIPTLILLAKNDKYPDWEKINMECQKNTKYVKLCLFEEGKHQLLKSNYKECIDHIRNFNLFCSTI